MMRREMTPMVPYTLPLRLLFLPPRPSLLEPIADFLVRGPRPGGKAENVGLRFVDRHAIGVKGKEIRWWRVKCSIEFYISEICEVESYRASLDDHSPWPSSRVTKHLISIFLRFKC